MYEKTSRNEALKDSEARKMCREKIREKWGKGEEMENREIRKLKRKISVK